MSDDNQQANQVGYKNPPRHSRFKPGQSGNPKGRPKVQQLNPMTHIFNELMKSVTIVENGKPTKVTKMAALTRRIIHDALKGDSKAMASVMKLLPKLEEYLIKNRQLTPPLIIQFIDNISGAAPE